MQSCSIGQHPLKVNYTSAALQLYIMPMPFPPRHLLDHHANLAHGVRHIKLYTQKTGSHSVEKPLPTVHTNQRNIDITRESDAGEPLLWLPPLQ